MRTFYIIFRDSICTGLIFKFLDREIQHVAVLEEVQIPGSEATLLIGVESNLSILSTTVLYNSIDTVIDMLQGPRVIKYTIAEVVDPKQMYYELFTCVTCVKRVLGIRKPFILTPKQLYHYLLDNGGEIYHETKGTKGNRS